MGAIDLLKSERGLVVLLYLGGLLALMLTGSPHVDRWGQYAGAIVAVYTAAKSLRPGARAGDRDELPGDPPKPAPEPAKPDPNGEILS